MFCRACSTASPPFGLVPISESVQIAATAAAGGGTTGTSSAAIAEKLGGYSGMPGVPVREIQLISSEQSSSVSILSPPPKPAGWMMRTCTCLHMLLSEIRTGAPSVNNNQLLRSVFPDELACALKASALDSPSFALQENSDSLRHALTRILLRCGAAIFPPIIQLGIGESGLPTPTLQRWRDSAIEILPLAE